MDSSSLRQEPALHTFKEPVHSEVYVVLVGHMSGMGFGANSLSCHGSEITQTPVLKTGLGHSPPWGQTPEGNNFFNRVRNSLPDHIS